MLNRKKKITLNSFDGTNGPRKYFYILAKLIQKENQMSSRIYVVGAPGSNKKRLVKAASPWQAIKHAVKDKVQANVATTVEVAELMQAGVELETAEVATVKKADPTEAPADEQAVE